MARKDETSLKTGRRQPLGRNHERGTPRIIWLAVLVGLIGAVLIFRTPGRGNNSGIGENRSIITSPTAGQDTLMVDPGVDDPNVENGGPAPKQHSGNVEIQDISSTLTPENPADGTTTKVTTPSAPVTKTPSVKTEVAKTPAKPSNPTTAPSAVPEIQPQSSGPYLIQSGSFGDPKNADTEAARLQALGWDARVKVSSTASGSMVYRVRMGFFANRTTAGQFIRAHRKELRGAIAVHR